MQEIITISKSYQKENIEALDKTIKNKIAEDWLNNAFLDFNYDEPNNKQTTTTFDKGIKKSNQDLYNDYPIKRKKIDHENALLGNKQQTKENHNINNQNPPKRMKKAKKQYSPTCSNHNEKKKKSHHHNSEMFKDKNSNHHSYSKTTKESVKNEKKERLDVLREKFENNAKKHKLAEKKKYSQKILEYPNFLDDSREE